MLDEELVGFLQTPACKQVVLVKIQNFTFSESTEQVQLHEGEVGQQPRHGAGNDIHSLLRLQSN